MRPGWDRERMRGASERSIEEFLAEAEEILEALAEGTPVVCTESSGIAAELARRNAALVTDGSPEELADAVGRLLADADLRGELARAGRRAIDEVFSIRAVVDRLEELYRDRPAHG